jgi:hypothetical protein
MSRLSPSLAVDAFDVASQQLSMLDERVMSLLVHTDMLAVDGYEVTNETKNALMRVVRHLRLLRFELMALGPVYRQVRETARRNLPS